MTRYKVAPLDAYDLQIFVVYRLYVGLIYTRRHLVENGKRSQKEMEIEIEIEIEREWKGVGVEKENEEVNK